MAATNPASIVAFTTKTNKVDIVDASHINRLQEEVVAEQTELGKDPAGSVVNLKTRLAVSLADSGAMAQGTSDPTSPTPVIGQPFYRTDTDQLKIYDGATWDVMGPGSMSVKSVTAISTGNSGTITIEAGKLYKVLISLTNTSADDIVGIRFNSNSTNNYENIADAGAPSTLTYGLLGQMDVGVARQKFLIAELLIDTNQVDISSARVIGRVLSYNNIGTMVNAQRSVDFTVSVTISSFEIFTVSASSITGNIYVYEYALSA